MTFERERERELVSSSLTKLLEMPRFVNTAG